MKTFSLLIATVALLVLGGQAPAAMRMPMVTVVMHDPGCHWFYADGHYKTSLMVKASMIGLRNYDEASLRVAGSSGVELLRTGQMLMLGHGNYRITMVGQARDDNHLKLTVK